MSIISQYGTLKLSPISAREIPTWSPRLYNVSSLLYETIGDKCIIA